MSHNYRKSNQLTRLARLSRAVWGDNAVEFLVGALASVTAESQIDVLINKLNNLLKLEREEK